MTPAHDDLEITGTPWPPGEPGPGNMKLVRHRDNQQWILDWFVKTTGRDRQFFYDDRKLPAGTRSYAMIPRTMERQARHKRTLARAAEAKGHRATAARLYQKAAGDYHIARHSLPFDDHPEKIYLHEQMRECFDRFLALTSVRVERIAIPWEGFTLDGLLYLADEQPAPTVLHINGMDMVKELLPDPFANPYPERGMNVAIIDGPGQGQTTMDKLRTTPDNFAPAMMAVLDALEQRDEVDADLIACVGISMGTFWGMQLAARDDRLKAIATHGGCYGPQHSIWQQCSPHFKRQFMYMAGTTDEEAFDRFAEQYVLTKDELAAVQCPVLFLHGEYDPLCPLDDALRVYDNLGGPKEFWLTEDDAHTPTVHPHLGGLQAVVAMADWIRDVFDGAQIPVAGVKRVLAEHRGAGPYSDPVDGFLLPERLGDDA
ncbi:MAG: alpha/beta fold hydrolase [Nitriliruptoraceae bacterium]